MISPSTVVVAMSGGVDSSVTALLLKQQGHRVIGMFMKNWEDDAEGVCSAEEDFQDVVRVCDQLKIPYYAVNFAKEYREQVFSHFLKQLEEGYTPNPDILCNREIKFKCLLEKAQDLGADFLATGHYCRIAWLDGKPCLYKGIDPSKDQSYFLHALREETLKHVLFPIGDLHKNEIRAIAAEYSLATAKKKDSTGICFIGKRDFKPFVQQYLIGQKGNFEDLQGNIIGQHDGIAFYTIGQRKGMGIGGPGEAWFVVGKDIQKNVIRLAQGANHPTLFSTKLVAKELSWVSEPPKTPFTCNSKVRYRQKDHACVIEKIEDSHAHITFSLPQRAVTPGQSIVFYSGDHCLGGGVIRGSAP